MRYEFKKAFYLVIITLATFGFSCSSSDETVTVPPEEVLVDSEESGERSLTAIQLVIDISGEQALQEIRNLLRYDVEFYQVIYKTEYLGQEIEASGLVTFPVTTDPVPMLSFQNGTNTENSAAPTVDTQNSSLFSSLASAGYIFVIPDYIGFGESSIYTSPYHQKEYTASAVLDLAEAAAQLADDLGYNFNSDLFLGGYSEGGYATMAAHKMYEETYQGDINLVASAPASGGYDVKAFQEYFFGLDTYADPYFMAFVALSYQTVYPELNLQLSDLFQEPYASDIPGLFDGTLSGGGIDASLTNQINQLIQPDALTGFDTDPKFENWRTAINDNNLTDWAPQNRMFMYHGDQDITVPFENSVSTYESLLAAGASANTISFTPIPGADHGSGIVPYLGDMLRQFEGLK